MVFENLTLFEITLEGAQFGPRSMNQAEDAQVDGFEAESTAGGRRGRFASVVVTALLVAGLALLYRRSRATDDEFEFEAVSEDPEADLATAQ